MRNHRAAFTLVELLIVIGITAVLIALLLPALGKARRQALDTRCAANLSEVARGLRAYANDNLDRYPDPYTLGGAIYRVGLGRKGPEAFSKRECYGLPAVLHGVGELDLIDPGAAPRNPYRYVDGTGNLWVCPEAPDWMRDTGNTYRWNLNKDVAAWSSGQRGKSGMRATADGTLPTEWVRCNDAFRPFAPVGKRRDFEPPGVDPQPVLPAADYVYPHSYGLKQSKRDAASRRIGTSNVLVVDGHVAKIAARYVPNAAGTGMEWKQSIVPQ